METYQQTRQSHWDSIAQKRDNWSGMGKWYHRRLIEIYQYPVSYTHLTLPTSDLV